MPTITRRLLDLAAGPHGVDRYVELINPLWTRDQPRARVLAAERRTPDSVTLTLAPGAGWAGFRAGQHVRVGVRIDGVRHTRCYSPAGAEQDEQIELTVARHPGGRVSQHLFEHARPGLVLDLSPAAGDFVLPARRPARLLLISGGSGITPVLSMLRTLRAEGHEATVTFLHYQRDPAAPPYREELDALGGPLVRIVRAYTRADGGELSGHLSAAHLAAVDADGAEVYVCGPPALVDAARELVPAERLHVECFRPLLLACAPLWGAAGAEGGEIRFARSGRTVPGDGRSLLEQAEAAGLRPASGCRMGICRSCTTRKCAGRVRDMRNGSLSDDGEHDIQLCVSAPAGDLLLDL